jgi:ribonuclease P protein component
MLPVERRVRRRNEFAAAVRDGRRASGPGVVIYLLRTPRPGLARAGFVVGRGVGPAVARNRLRRQLRHLLAPRLAALPDGIDVVVRALPGLTGGSLLAPTVDGLLGRLVDSGVPA